MPSTYQRAFAGGELAPQLAARADLAKYTTGLRTCRNFMVLRSGGVANRSGTRFIGASRDSSTSTRLMKYVSEVVGESILIESGTFYLRFYRQGALVTLAGVAAYNGATAYVIGDIALSGGVNYYCVKNSTGNAPPNATFWYAMPSNILELPIPFGNSGFNWTQSGTTITLTAALVPPYELIYVSATRWIIRAVSTAPGILPPTAIVITPGLSGTQAFQYVVTSAAQTTYEESVASAIQQVNTVTDGTPTNPLILNWTPPIVGAVAEYYVYKDPTGDGTFGFIGTATGGTTFHDIGQLPDYTLTPPQPRILFTTAGNFPQKAAYYQQRRFFANTLNDPDAVWGSRVGFPANFNQSSPLQDDDAITFRIAGTQRNPVRHLLGLKSLVVLTDGGEWTVGQAKTPLTPSNLPADQETYVGVSDCVPVIIGNSILYMQARGSIVRDLQFNLQVNGLDGRDLTLYAAHLFDGFTISQIDYQQVPHSIVWACRSDGALLGLTYIREQDIWGWHRHDTGASGSFEDVCVVPEPGEDAVYVLVRRVIGGNFVRYIERLAPRQIVTFNVDAFFVDAGLTYNGAPATTIAGLGHLNGQVVAVLADGQVIFNGDPTAANAAQYTVGGGTIPAILQTPASVISAGLQIVSDLETLDLDVAGLQVQVRDRRKRVHVVSLLLDQSCRTFKVGPDVTHLNQVKLMPIQANQAFVPFSGQESINLTAMYNDYGRVFIRQTDPLPLTVLGLLPDVELGG